MADRPLNTRNLITVVSVAILVGTELIGVALAAGWAIAGLFQLGKGVEYALMGLFAGLGAYGLFLFVKQAMRIEPIRG
jgi:hypothetical protein